ncbi:hypothetical protein [Streptomyces sp. NPDC090025]|uniref:hypothetical protein n=1 Tax=Streptomyces sp. NPDC090025 TaxID=3365922 RepID=UPI003833F46D
MNTVPSPRRALAALAAATLLGTGLLLGQTAAAPRADAAVRTPITCDVPRMRHDAAALRAKADKLQHLGATTEAREARAQAAALDRRIQACVDADDHAGKPFPG